MNEDVKITVSFDKLRFKKAFFKLNSERKVSKLKEKFTNFVHLFILFVILLVIVLHMMFFN